MLSALASAEIAYVVRALCNIGTGPRQSTGTREKTAFTRWFLFNLGRVLVAKNLHLPDFLLYWARLLPKLARVVPEVDMNDQASPLNDDGIDPAARAAGHQPALTGCPWHDVNEMLQAAGLRPTRQRMALGWLLFGKGARHLTAEMLYEEATLAKVPVSLATVYNTLNQLTDAGLLRQVSVDGTKTYFDTNVTAHHHFYLENNHELVDIPDPHLVLSKMPDVPEGYEIARVDMVVRLRKKR
ncbi:Fur family iron response transcriptional regulator [Bradyrhizobium algeriense]